MIGVVVVMVGVLGVPVVPVVVDCLVDVPVVPGGQASGTKQQIIPKTS